MARFICTHIKRDGTICGNRCCDLTGCYRHQKLYEKNMKKFHCLGCGFLTNADSGFYSKYCSKYSAKFHSHNYQMRQKRKTKTEALQPAKISELSYETLQPRIPEAQFLSRMIIVLRSMNTCFSLLHTICGFVRKEFNGFDLGRSTK